MIGPVNIRAADFPKKPGLWLNSTALIIDEAIIRQFHHRRDSIVFAFIPGNTYTPFVSWHRIVTNDTPNWSGEYKPVETLAYGDYYRPPIDEAMAAYHERVKKIVDTLTDDDSTTD